MVALEFRHIYKSFGGVHALADISFSIEEGQICSIVGENGAGKSTLMKIISGAHAPDKGELILFGKQIKHFNPGYAQANGIGIVYQELSLIKDMPIYENIFLGRPAIKNGYYDHKYMIKKAAEAIKEVGLHNVTPKSLIRDLSTAQQQLVEIARIVFAESKIIIMDEPTSSLANEDSDRLLDLLIDLKNKGKTVLYISHRLNEVQKISDSIAVLRDGHFVGHSDAGQLDRKDVIKMMVGKNIDTIEHQKKDAKGNGEILEVNNLKILPKIKDASFKLYKGEVLGFAGLVGAGRTELVRGMLGVDKIEHGQVILNGKKMRKASPYKMIKNKTRVCLVPESRKTEGLVFGKSIKENMALSYRLVYKGIRIKPKVERIAVDSLCKRLEVKSSGISQNVDDLSGGNQQKVVLAKALAAKPDILILDEPTRGIDVGAKVEIHKIIIDLANQGVSIIIVSSELSELALLCDRVLVMADGNIVAELEGDVKETDMLKKAIPI
jgi:ABC-type sugar transport system ATPase subunit